MRGDAELTRARPRHRRRRRPGRVGWSGAAAVVLVAGAAGWWHLATNGGPAEAHPRDASSTVTGPAGSAGGSTREAALVVVPCWDGTSAASQHACGPPTGRTGLATVFPGIGKACRPGPATRAGALEEVTCHGEGYVVRYTRWRAGYDRFARLDRAAGSTGTRWYVGGEFAGRTWAADRRPSSSVPHPARWAATYRAYPYSVEVLAVSDATRRIATTGATAARPSHVGRR